MLSSGLSSFHPLTRNPWDVSKNPGGSSSGAGAAGAAGYGPLHTAHADLLDRAGRTEEATAAWSRAIEATDNTVLREELRRRAADRGQPGQREP